ncbi:hypothetical protein DUI87_32977 [Hirundo rustica rustica]|uniref:Nudix hydrolase domain-containing protein n=1 Tax=Hirundo rustica rustica TaxID=333673 RepID=A0A3M0IQG5_HIRRU|nr:hypothetical protein DUI87_32977 [Hirundo rustica rustica]
MGWHSAREGERPLQRRGRGGAVTAAAVSPQSVTGVFCPAHTDAALVSCGLERGRFLISDVPFPGSAVTVLKRSPLCPAKLGRATPGERGAQPGVAAAVAVLLEAACGRVLLTRRAATLRHFPGVWVPPGGHLEPGEEARLCPSPCEVSAVAWLEPLVLEAIAATEDGSEGSGSGSFPTDLPATVGITELSADGFRSSQIPTGILLRRAPARGPDLERVSTGTKFALGRWRAGPGQRDRE